MNTFKKIINRVVKDVKDYRWAIILLIVYFCGAYIMFGSFCPMVIATGFPCPGCGLTRAALNIFKGNIRECIYYNPTIFIWVIYIVGVGFERYVLDKTKIRKWQILLAIIAFITVVVYIYRMKLYFPNREPLIYNRNNLIYFMLNNKIG